MTRARFEGVTKRASDGPLGEGLFATRTFQANDLIFEVPPPDIDGGEWELTRQRMHILPPPARNLFLRYGYQVGLDRFRGPVVPAVLDHDITYFMNHSCAPNAWHEDGAMFALVDIEPGDEITYDYGMTELGAQPWTCACGAAECRRIVGGNPSIVYRRYQGRCLRHVRQAALLSIHRAVRDAQPVAAASRDAW